MTSHQGAMLWILVWSMANLVYTGWFSPHNLAPDEGHYWDWSRQLDWSYYSKGPLVAWLIRLSSEVLTPFQQLLGFRPELLVRFPAVVCHALLLVALHRLSFRIYRNTSLALVTVLLATTLSLASAHATLMTIDAPFLCAWAWAVLWLHQALSQSEASCRYWVLAGLATALGILAKYTMLLVPGCLTLMLLFHHEQRRYLWTRAYWLYLLLSSLGGLPILYWNAQHGWIGFAHVGTLAGVLPQEVTPSPMVLLGEFLAGQVGVLLIYWCVAGCLALWQARPWVNTDQREHFLWWFAAPVIGLFTLASLKTRAQPNWLAPAYLTAFVLTVAWIWRQIHTAPGRYRMFARTCLVIAIGLGLSTSLYVRFPSLGRPLLVHLARVPSPDRPAPLRDLDPTCRLAGWQGLARYVDSQRTGILQQTGQEPILAAERWNLPGNLGFYCQGTPQVYSFGAIITDRHNQYDIWRPNPVADAQEFQGRSFVYVGTNFPGLTRMFDRVEPPVEIVISDGGIPVANWKVWVCHGYRGCWPSGDTDRTRGY